ncbi:MAG: FHA domain-containing protein, partial [Singulisphaera sp.]
LVFDDGEDTGEVVRVRAGSFIIGRVEGDLVIPHDGGISGRHAEILRRVENGSTVWVLRDLNSTNGTFARASTVILHHDQELLIGGLSFRFTAPAPGFEEPDRTPRAERDPQVGRVVRAGVGGTSSSLPPTLSELAAAEGKARSFHLTQTEHWLGSDPSQCSIVIDDPTVDPKHARVYRDDHNRWVIANERSRNGLWARVQEIALGRGGYFQCGEQRFLFKVL